MNEFSDGNRADELFRLAVESSPCAMIMVDSGGKIALVNSQTVKLFGYPRSELIGQPIEMLVPDTHRKGHPAHRGKYLAQPEARPMEAGRELRARHKDGRQIPVEISLNPVETAGGAWVLTSIMDITERQQLRESEERFRNMADTAPVMIWVSGHDKLCTFFNKAWLEFRGRPMEKEVGNGWAEGVHPADLDRCLSTYNSCFDARRGFRMEYRMRRANSDYRWILDEGVPRFAPGGAFAGYIGSCIDITDVKHTLEASLASQKLETVGQLASGIAHDFNNLLGGILASAELGLAEYAERASPEEELKRIRTAAIRGGEIVRQLMIYGGNESPANEPVDVSCLVEEMLHLLKISISKHAILETELGEGLPAVHANPAQIRQVVMNLITNASEAIGERHGVIRVRTTTVSRANDYLKLEVSDTGSGMTPEIQSRIFDPFFTTKFTGRGLGLATVQGIVRSHAGTINVASSPGQGTRFEVLLPCIAQPAREFRRPEPYVSTGAGVSATGTVLVVEDEETLRLAVSKMLRAKGFSVIEAKDGSAAVELFQSSSSDITAVLLDMTLPGLSGAEVFAELRRIRPDGKVILTSAYSLEAVATAVGGQQDWNFIRKPYLLTDLVDVIQNACVKTSMSGRATG
jgi:PAS domain S-box-containing protein